MERAKRYIDVLAEAYIRIEPTLTTRCLAERIAQYTSESLERPQKAIEAVLEGTALFLSPRLANRKLIAHHVFDSEPWIKIVTRPDGLFVLVGEGTASITHVRVHMRMDYNVFVQAMCKGNVLTSEDMEYVGHLNVNDYSLSKMRGEYLTYSKQLEEDLQRHKAVNYDLTQKSIVNPKRIRNILETEK